MTDKDKTLLFLAAQTHMVIAVTLADGTPWAVPVAIKHWDDTVFEWISHLDTVHSLALEKNPRMAITLFQKDTQTEIGVYAKGVGVLVEDRGDGYGRYAFTAEKMWLNDESFVKRAVSL